ncbi:MAG: hypothetical protein ACD_46C00575G0001 [uncultured bacterium]|nr:MAG: hypothetical protein ACD_46C00575G0001 [uncultured bacterium]
MIPIASPRIFVYYVSPATSDYPGRIKGLVKIGLDGSATKEDIIHFIEPIDPDLKQQNNYTSLRDKY